MAAGKSAGKEFIKYHNDGTIWAKGQTIKGMPAGYGEWFRKDGSKMRSGHFEKGKPVGEWITCDRKGRSIKSQT
jgi:hypothetical protein